MQVKILVPVLILVEDLLLCNLILISSVLIILHPFIIYHILPSYSVILTERWTDIDPSSTVVGCVVAAGRRQGSYIRDLVSPLSDYYVRI